MPAATISFHKLSTRFAYLLLSFLPLAFIPCTMSSSSSQSAASSHQQSHKRPRAQPSEHEDVSAATINEAVQAALDSSAASSSSFSSASLQPAVSRWEPGLSSLISAYAAPLLQYHVLASAAWEPDVTSFDSAQAMLQDLRRRYHKQPPERKDGEASEEDKLEEVEAECVRLLAQNATDVTHQQEDEDEENDPGEFPFDDVSTLQHALESSMHACAVACLVSATVHSSALLFPSLPFPPLCVVCRPQEIGALHGQRLTLAAAAERKAAQHAAAGGIGAVPWSAATSPALSPSLASLQPPYVLFQQCNLRWKEQHRDGWEVKHIGSDDELVHFLRTNPAGHEGHRPRDDADEQRAGEHMELHDLLRRALWHSEQDEEELKGSDPYLAAIFHRVRVVWDVRAKVTDNRAAAAADRADRGVTTVPRTSTTTTKKYAGDRLTSTTTTRSQTTGLMPKKQPGARLDKSRH